MGKAWEEVISEILIELDQEHAEYQRLHKKLHGSIDADAKYGYDSKVSLLELLRKRTLLREGGK